MDEEKDLNPQRMSGDAPGNGAGGVESEGAGEPPALPASPGASEITDKLLAEKQELYDRLLRKQAEYDNFRKRAHKEKEELRQHAAEEVVRSLLPILDAFERALQHRAEDVPETYYEGLELIYRQLQDALGRTGLVAIEAKGELFDPRLHQAVETIVAPGHREHEIVEQVQRGYKLKQRLLRPALVKVVVSSQGENAGAAENGPEKV